MSEFTYPGRDGRPVRRAARQRTLTIQPRVPEMTVSLQGLATESGGIEQQEEMNGTASAIESGGQRPERINRGRGRMVRASEITPKKYEWLWQDRIPLGALTILAGDAGLGKSMLTVLLAAELSRGRLNGIPGNTIILNAEDNLEATIMPRLQAAGADLDRIAIPPDKGGDTPTTFPSATAWLAKTIIEEEARLVIIDPLVNHLDSTVNSWKDQSVRTALRPLHEAAEATGSAVVVIMHLNKTQGSAPLNRIGGSTGLGAAARSALLFARDPNDPNPEAGVQRALTQLKTNLGRQAPTLLYEIEEITLGTAEGERAPRLNLTGESTLNPSDFSDTGGASALGEAVDFLKYVLADGQPQSAKATMARAMDEGISITTLKRAKNAAGIITKKGNPAFTWRLAAPSKDTEGEPASL